MATRRIKIIQILENEQITCEELSSIFGITLREIVDELREIAVGRKLHSRPAQCVSCGFVFKQRLDRNMFKTPTKCPKCHNLKMDKPLFWLDRKLGEEKIK